MPRQARQASSTGIYHLIVRGINREVIFQDDNDRQRYIATLARIATDSNATVLGYCLMDNHVHFLIKEDLTSISKLMHRLGASYAHYYNARYERVGHIFRNRNDTAITSPCVPLCHYRISFLNLPKSWAICS